MEWGVSYREKRAGLQGKARSRVRHEPGEDLDRKARNRAQKENNNGSIVLKIILLKHAERMPFLILLQHHQDPLRVEPTEPTGRGGKTMRAGRQNKRKPPF